MQACLLPPPAPAPRPAPAPVTRPRSQVPGRGKTSRAASPGAGGAAPLPRADSCGLTVAVLSPSASSRRVPSGGGASRAGSVASGRPGWATGLGVVRGKIVISVIRHGGTAQRRVGSTRSSVRPGRRHQDGTGSLEDGDALLLGAVTAASPAGMPGCCWRLGGHKGGVRDAQPLSRPAGWQLRSHPSRRSRKPVGHPRGRRPCWHASLSDASGSLLAVPRAASPAAALGLARMDGPRRVPHVSWSLTAGRMGHCHPASSSDTWGQQESPPPHLTPPHDEAAPDTHQGLPVGRDPRGHRAGDRPPASSSLYATGLPPRLHP